MSCRLMVLLMMLRLMLLLMLPLQLLLLGDLVVGIEGLVLLEAVVWDGSPSVTIDEACDVNVGIIRRKNGPL